MITQQDYLIKEKWLQTRVRIKITIVTIVQIKFAAGHQEKHSFLSYKPIAELRRGHVTSAIIWGPHFPVEMVKQM